MPQHRKNRTCFSNSLDGPRAQNLTVEFSRLCVEVGLEVGGGGGEGAGVGVAGEGPQLGLHLGGAAGDAARADLQVDPCNRRMNAVT